MPRITPPRAKRCAGLGWTPTPSRTTNLLILEETDSESTTGKCRQKSRNPLDQSWVFPPTFFITQSRIHEITNSHFSHFSHFFLDPPNTPAVPPPGPPYLTLPRGFTPYLPRPRNRGSF